MSVHFRASGATASTSCSARSRARRAVGWIGALSLLCAVSGCPDCPVPLSTWDTEAIDLGVTDDLNAVLIDVSRSESRPVLRFVGTGGVVAQLSSGAAAVQRPVEADLRDIAQTSDDLLFVVGDDGVILGSQDRGTSWERLESGTTAALRAVAAVPSGNGDIVVAAGAEVVLVRTALTGEWSAVEPPDGGWGDVLRFVQDGPQLLALGRGGAMWRTTDARGSWVRVATGASADLRAAGWVQGATPDGPGAFIVAGSDGTILVREAGWEDASPGFRPIETDVEVGFVAFAAGDLDDYLLDEEGRVYETHALVSEQELVLLFDAGFPARAMAFDFEDNSVAEIGGGDHVIVVAGAGGEAVSFRLNCAPRCEF